MKDHIERFKVTYLLSAIMIYHSIIYRLSVDYPLTNFKGLNSFFSWWVLLFIIVMILMIIGLFSILIVNLLKYILDSIKSELSPIFKYFSKSKG